eukprot:GHVR01032439.1.p1 GENE.GHVR01032439.1~~GHVR01032439.1.p1  ORF type:complete len:144 (+),score=20.10 GHVR01032439.1:174-605(+)
MAKAIAIRNGFKINWMNMKDAETGEVIWTCDNWDRDSPMKEANIPARILDSKLVSREINFSSKEVIARLNLEQRIFFKGKQLEVWDFDFGFVIPNSTNLWQQTITAAQNVMTPEELSGNVSIETTFFDGSVEIVRSVVKIFYK